MTTFGFRKYRFSDVSTSCGWDSNNKIMIRIIIIRGGGSYIYEQNIVTTLISYSNTFKFNIQILTSSNTWHKQVFLSFFNDGICINTSHRHVLSFHHALLFLSLSHAKFKWLFVPLICILFLKVGTHSLCHPTIHLYCHELTRFNSRNFYLVLLNVLLMWDMVNYSLKFWGGTWGNQSHFRCARVMPLRSFSYNTDDPPLSLHFFHAYRIWL